MFYRIDRIHLFHIVLLIILLIWVWPRQRSSQHLNNMERDLLAEILREYAHTVATSKEDLRRFDLAKHGILITDKVPVQVCMLVC